MVVRIADLVPSCDTTEQGDVVFATLRKAFQGHSSVVVSFAGISTVTSSFVNSALVGLLASLPFAELKTRLHIVDSTRQINEMIRHRLTMEAGRERMYA